MDGKRILVVGEGYKYATLKSIERILSKDKHHNILVVDDSDTADPYMPKLPDTFQLLDVRPPKPPSLVEFNDEVFSRFKKDVKPNRRERRSSKKKKRHKKPHKDNLDYIKMLFRTYNPKP